MTLLTPALPSTDTTAAREAARNWAANCTALAEAQPHLVDALRDIPIDLTWLYARDDSLHAMDGDGKWFAGCSVPLLAGRTVIKSLEPSSSASCFLAPAHAGLLRAARERAGDDAALLAIIPDPITLRIVLACHDFSDEIAGHRLWFAAGMAWADEMRRLFDDQSGLPTPSRFIRTKLVADDVLDPMIADAQRVFADVLAHRTRMLDAIRSAEVSVDANRLLLIAGSRFRLWDDAATILADALAPAVSDQGLTLDRFDSDDPATSSPLALATTAAGCGAVIAANVCRADAANLVAIDTPWLTWVTRPTGVPTFANAGPRDAIVLADAAWRIAATNAGWPADRVALAGWPREALPNAVTTSRTLAIIADTQPIELPKTVEDFSSHRVLWSNIEAELFDDPFAVEDDAIAYLHDRSARLNIAPDAPDQRRFIENLILPAYAQSLARLLIRAGLPLRIHGRGWDAVDELSAHAVGAVGSRESLLMAVATATALIYVWPARHTHPIDTLGRRVVHRTGRRPQSFVQEAKLALQSTATAPPSRSTESPLGETILRLLNTMRSR